jgi:hypothetical protein
MLRPARVLGIALLWPLLLTPLAEARPLPDPKTRVIIPPSETTPGSLGGLRGGMRLAAANRSWGAKGRCYVPNLSVPTSRYCKWGNRNGNRGTAEVFAFRRRVDVVALVAGPVRNPVFRGPLLQFETRRGHIGLGDSLAEVLVHFPEAKLGGDSEQTEYTLTGSGSTLTFVAVEEDDPEDDSIDRIVFSHGTG